MAARLDSANSQREVWITGIGLVSSYGEGLDVHRKLASIAIPTPIVDETSFAPYPIFPICELDYSQQIPKRGDLRQMEDWQRIGTYAAGLALDDSGLKDNTELLVKTHILAAAGNGERDPEADRIVLEALAGRNDWPAHLNELLLANLRPTLYLAQQTQLLAGNISIVHKVTGGSRTFKGEEVAGAQIVENAVERICSGQNDIFLVGAAYNAARWDQLLIWKMSGQLFEGAHRPDWLSKEGMIPGSVGVFLVVESRAHAEARGAKPYAAISSVEVTGHNEQFDDAIAAKSVPTLYFNGASGTPRSFEESRRFAESCEAKGVELTENIYGRHLGHSVETHFPLGVALAALRLSSDDKTAPSRALVTGWGMAVGNGIALVERVEE